MSARMIRKRFDFDEKDIAAGKYSAWELIQPLWFTVSIYDGLAVYEQDLQPFSAGQRMLFALQWYDSEVCNGGHDQFFFNSTGIIWKDALAGLKVIGAQTHAENLQKAIDQFGGSVPFDRAQRNEQLEALCESEDFDDFDALDTFYYNAENEQALSQHMEGYVQAHAADFVLHGEYPYYE